MSGGPALDIPVVLLVFKRPDTTRRVFEAVARARPRTLLVVADGARPDRPGEEEACRLTRSIATAVDWPCELLTDFSPHNQGCRRRVVSGLNWAFSQVPEAIVLEDDCLPDPSFFPYCAELLARYREDPRVMMISGDNFLFGRHIPQSYYFSKFAHIWGWATWRRAWTQYSDDPRHWEALAASDWLERELRVWRASAQFRMAMEQIRNGQLDSWAYHWALSILRAKGLAIAPARNLVANIGIGAEATHTKGVPLEARAALEHLELPLRHPLRVDRNLAADRREAAQLLYKTQPGLWRRWRLGLSRWMKQQPPK